MENLLAPETAGVIIQSIAAIVVAVITYVLGPIVGKLISGKSPTRFVDAVVAGISGALTFIVIGIVVTVLTPEPTVTIITPSTGQPIEVQLAETGAASFIVTGTSSRVSSRVSLAIGQGEPSDADLIQVQERTTDGADVASNFLSSVMGLQQKRDTRPIARKARAL